MAAFTNVLKSCLMKKSAIKLQSIRAATMSNLFPCNTTDRGHKLNHQKCNKFFASLPTISTNNCQMRLGFATIAESVSGKGSSDKSGNPNDKENPSEKKDKWYSGKNAWKFGLVSLVGMGVMTGSTLLFSWGAPLYDENGEEIPDEFSILPSWQAYPKRAIKEFHFFKQMIQEPSSKKLLPDPLKEPYYQPPYTLVLEMTGVLVHPDWTLNTGWRFKKRPAVDFFLQQCAPPLFEIVVYTHEQGFTAFPIIDGLDPNGFISFRLFRDATRYQNGTHVKDLDCLNRDLSKVIIVDCDYNAFGMHPRNALGLKKWAGDDNDRTLVDLAAFLRTIATSGVEDIRTVLEHYNQFPDPLEAFKENQIRLQAEQDKVAKKKAEEQQNRSLTSNFSFGLSGRRK